MKRQTIMKKVFLEKEEYHKFSKVCEKLYLRTRK